MPRNPQTVNPLSWRQSAKKVAWGGRDRPCCKGIAMKIRLGRLLHFGCYFGLFALFILTAFHTADTIPVKKQFQEESVCSGLELKRIHSIVVWNHEAGWSWCICSLETNKTRKLGQDIKCHPSDPRSPSKFILLNILPPFREQHHQPELSVQTLMGRYTM